MLNAKPYPAYVLVRKTKKETLGLYIRNSLRYSLKNHEIFITNLKLTYKANAKALAKKARSGLTENKAKDTLL